MKKTFAIILAVCALSSCCLDNSDQDYRTASALAEFGNMLCNRSMSGPVNHMSAYVIDSLLSEVSFPDTAGAYNVMFKVEKQEDSLFTVQTLPGYSTSFTTTMRLLKENLSISYNDSTYYFPAWELTTSGNYEEKGDYSATFSTSGAVKYYYSLSSGPSILSCRNGDFKFDTFYKGDKVDYGTLTYKNQTASYDGSLGKLGDLWNIYYYY